LVGADSLSEESSPSSLSAETAYEGWSTFFLCNFLSLTLFTASDCSSILLNRVLEGAIIYFGATDVSAASERLVLVYK